MYRSRPKGGVTVKSCSIGLVFKAVQEKKIDDRCKKKILTPDKHLYYANPCLKSQHIMASMAYFLIN